jgi:hypothetical protein
MKFWRKSNNEEIDYERKQYEHDQRVRTVKKGATLAVKSFAKFLILLPIRIMWDVIKTPFSKDGDR